MAITALGLVAGSAVAAAMIAWLLARRWPWQQFGDTASQSDVLKLALGVVAAGGAAVALVVNFRRQQILEVDEAGRRDQIRLYVERFGAAAAQLGGEQAPVRLAGVYAMAALADEWIVQRQQCIDVLCGYLRLPYVGDPAPGHPDTVTVQRHYAGGAVQRTQTTTYKSGERQVRAAIVDTMRQHLQPDAQTSWSDLNLDFTGAVLEDARFDGAIFAGQNTYFGEATFTGKYTDFAGATFRGKYAGFVGATFTGESTNFRRATFTGETTNFRRATFPSDTAFREATFTGETTDFAGASFTGDAVFAGSTFSGNNTNFVEATFSDIDIIRAAIFTNPDGVMWGSLSPNSGS